MIVSWTEIDGKNSATVDKSISPGWLRALASRAAPPRALSSIRATMIHNSASSRVFKISELTRLIASELVHISRRSMVDLACVCRSLEEPILSTLWETQWALDTLLELLPEWTRETEDLRYGKFVVCDLDPS